MKNIPEVGEKAPDFEAETYEGKKLKLSNYKNGMVALYFYPKDNSGTCTKEACSIRDSCKDLEKNGIKVIGVSTDTVKSHEKFRDKFNLTFPLVSDRSREIVSIYGVESEYGSARRITFLIDKKGIIRHRWLKVKAADHGREILDAVNELGA